MKKFISFGLIVFFLSSFIGQAQNEVEDIAQIKKWYQTIEENLDNCITYKVDEFVHDDNSGENSSELLAFFDKETNQFVKLVEYTAGEWHEQWMSYYFNNGTLFFIFVEGYYGGDYYSAEELDLEEEEYYQMGLEPKNLDAYEERFYFSQNECIEYLTKSKTINIDAPRDLSNIKNEDGDLYDIDYNYYSKHAANMLQAVKSTMSSK